MVFMKRIFILSTALFLSYSSFAIASQEGVPLKEVAWPFSGTFGKVDKAAAQRGYQVYKQVCSACHSLKRLSYRNLQEIGFSEAEVKALAGEIKVTDGPNDQGDMFERQGRPSDHFKSPFANDQAARSANNGALPPDLSLIVKARHDGANYIYSLLTGFGQAVPHDVTLAQGMSYNPYFPGKQIGMPTPLTDGAVDYQDGTKATIDQMSKDVVVFLQWAAEPEMQQRKEAGIKVLIYLAFFTGIFYMAKRIIWKNVK